MKGGVQTSPFSAFNLPSQVPIYCKVNNNFSSNGQSGIRTCLFGLRLYVPVNNFSVMSGRNHRFLGITSTFWKVNVSCSRIRGSVRNN